MICHGMIVIMCVSGLHIFDLPRHDRDHTRAHEPGTTINIIALPFVILFLYYACPNNPQKGEAGFCLSGVDLASLKDMPLP